MENDNEYTKDLREIEQAIAREKRISDYYINKTIARYRNIGNSEMVKSAVIKKYKIPFKLKAKNFWNKFVNMFK